MPGSADENQGLPEHVRILITRKLNHAHREKGADLNRAINKIFKELDDHVQTILTSLDKSGDPNSIKASWTRAFVHAALKLYRQIAETAVDATKKWPDTVWAMAKLVLDKSGVVLRDGDELNAIVDEFSWAIGREPFTARYVDAKRFKEAVHRIVERYGLHGEEYTVEFDRQLDLAASVSVANIMNAARSARSGVRNDIDEYVLEVRAHTDDEDRNELSTDANCISNPPKKTNDWFEVIKAMTEEFYKDNQRCPSNNTEAWDRLRKNPPKGYSITSEKDRGEDAISMDGKMLGRRSFNDRWRRYTAQ